jgi:hypothetical protein
MIISCLATVILDNTQFSFVVRNLIVPLGRVSHVLPIGQTDADGPQYHRKVIGSKTRWNWPDRLETGEDP